MMKITGLFFLSMLFGILGKGMMIIGQDSLVNIDSYVPIVGILERIRKTIDRIPKKYIVAGILNFLIACFMHLHYKSSILHCVNILAFLSVLLPCSLYDLRYEIVPNKILLTGFVLKFALIAAEIVSNPRDSGFIFLNYTIAGFALLVIGLICRLFGRDSIGMGDVKILALTGFYLGVDGSFYAVFASIIPLFVFASFLLITKKAQRDTAIPFVPFLLVGLIVSVILYGI